MQFEAKLTLDGLMTLVAGVIAFIAVIIQIHSSSKQLQDQMDAQRDAEQDELERKKRAVATAIDFEIDSIYRTFVRSVKALFESAASEHDFAQRLVGKGIEWLPFTV
jgi:sensor domain CHASE-containing protein